MRAELADLRSGALETREFAERGSSAALAASDRADEARKLAEVAAGARKTAEFERQQAVVAAQQAQGQALQAQTQAQQAQGEMERMRRERDEELNQMQQALNRIVETRRTSNGMVMILPDSTFRFDFDSADLNQKNRELLSRISGVLLVSKGYGLAIHGYTDDVGTPEYNKQLSLRRAQAVHNFLAQSGVDKAIMSVAGYGKGDPRVQGNSNEARSKNRRVEIAVIDSSIKYLGEAPAK
jgi:outer membrane protein OmpA-like peptidoglycan-associated protein